MSESPKYFREKIKFRLKKNSNYFLSASYMQEVPFFWLPPDVLNNLIIGRHLSLAALLACSMTCSRLRTTSTRIIDRYITLHEDFTLALINQAVKDIECEDKKIKIVNQVEIPISFLEWLEHDLKYPQWKLQTNTDTYGQRVSYTNRVIEQGIEEAASRGHLSMIQYLVHREPTIADTLMESDTIMMRAAYGGKLQVLQWLRQQLKCVWDEGVCSQAALGGYLQILKWARENGCPWNASTCTLAACSGSLDVLKWAHENGCLWSSSTCFFAAQRGDMVMLNWAHENGCPWDERVCASAAERGDLDMLKSVRQKKCPWDDSTCRDANTNGHLHVLKWAVENGCPVSERTWSKISDNKNKYPEIAKWAQNQLSPVIKRQ